MTASSDLLSMPRALLVNEGKFPGPFCLGGTRKSLHQSPVSSESLSGRSCESVQTGGRSPQGAAPRRTEGSQLWAQSRAPRAPSPGARRAKKPLGIVEGLPSGATSPRRVAFSRRGRVAPRARSPTALRLVRRIQDSLNESTRGSSSQRLRKAQTSLAHAPPGRASLQRTPETRLWSGPNASPYAALRKPQPYFFASRLKFAIAEQRPSISRINLKRFSRRGRSSVITNTASKKVARVGANAAIAAMARA